jgi:hypothetical protein
VEVLPVPFLEMIQKTANPFISAIRDLDIGKPSFFAGNLLFGGDALATFRPHVASSTQQAAIKYKRSSVRTLHEVRNQPFSLGT